MSILPAAFIERMKKQLPEEEWQAFFAVYEGEQPSCKGLRVNPSKCSAAEFEKISPFPLRPVPWEKNGFYADAEKLGAHPYYFAGLYYPQEPSAMLPVAALSGEEPILPPELTPVSGRRRVPILGSAACGEPIYSPGDGTDYITVEDDLPCDFALIAEGDSMIGDRIHSGDVVFLRSQDHVQDGEIAAVALDNEVTLKHVRRLRGPDGNIAFTQLLPSNPAYAPIDIGGEGETRMVRILGKAVAVRFML